jgi:hypothetical protein
MHVRTVELLRIHYDLEQRPVKVVDPYQMLGEIEEDLMACLRVDTMGMVPSANIFGFRNEGWKMWTAPWGQELLVAADFQTVKDSKGDTLVFPKGDRCAPPSARLFLQAICRYL